MGRMIDAEKIPYFMQEDGTVVAYKADIEQLPTADIDTDSAYAEGWTAAESKYRAMMSDGDCISRQAAKDAVREEWDGCCSEYDAGTIVYDTVEAIDRLPSAQQFHNTTLREVLAYIDGMPEDVWQEFAACLECRGWYLVRRGAKWCGGDFA